MTPWTIQSMEFSRLNTGAGGLSLLQEIFPTQESNQGLLHCRWILYQLSHQGSPTYRWLWKADQCCSLLVGTSSSAPGEGNGSPLRCSCLENPMGRGAWRASIHGVARVGHHWVAITTPPPPAWPLPPLSPLVNEFSPVSVSLLLFCCVH